jgi:hypothetical protein
MADEMKSRAEELFEHNVAEARRMLRERLALGATVFTAVEHEDDRFHVRMFCADDADALIVAGPAIVSGYRGISGAAAWAMRWQQSNGAHVLGAPNANAAAAEVVGALAEALFEDRCSLVQADIEPLLERHLRESGAPIAHSEMPWFIRATS